MLNELKLIDSLKLQTNGLNKTKDVANANFLMVLKGK